MITLTFVRILNQKTKTAQRKPFLAWKPDGRHPTEHFKELGWVDLATRRALQMIAKYREN